jgi:hypothetical protein
VSWKVTTGFDRLLFGDRSEHLIYRLNPGGGVTWGDQRLMAYGLMETDLLLGGRFDDSFALGLGGSVGLLTNPLPDWKIHLSGRQLWYAEHDLERAMELSVKQSWQLTANTSLILELARLRSNAQSLTDTTLLFNLYW